MIPNGRLGNNLFQLSLMNSLKIHCPNLKVLLPSFPELNIDESAGYSEALCAEPELRVLDHQLDFDAVIRFINLNPTALIHCSAWGMNPSVYSHSRSYLRSLLANLENRILDQPAQILRFHIRGGDLWQNPIYRRSRYIHPDYSSIPVSFYKKVLELTDSQAEFVIEKSVPSWYLTMLQRSLGLSMRRSELSSIQDFMRIASSTEVGLGVSTFSWMAAFIGEPKRVHLPVLGIFDANRRPDLNFRNPSWHTIEYEFEEHTWTGTSKDKDWLRSSECQSVL